jgi:hypothetical protein
VLGVLGEHNKALAIKVPEELILEAGGDELVLNSHGIAWEVLL